MHVRNTYTSVLDHPYFLYKQKWIGLEVELVNYQAVGYKWFIAKVTLATIQIGTAQLELH